MQLSKHGPQGRTQDPVETQQFLLRNASRFRRGGPRPSRRHSPALGSILSPAGTQQSCAELLRPAAPPVAASHAAASGTAADCAGRVWRSPSTPAATPAVGTTESAPPHPPRKLCPSPDNRPAKRSTRPLARRTRRPSSPSSPKVASFSSPSGLSKCGPVRPPGACFVRTSGRPTLPRGWSRGGLRPHPGLEE